MPSAAVSIRESRIRISRVYHRLPGHNAWVHRRDSFRVVGSAYAELSPMRTPAANFEAVRAVGREFPDLQEGTMYGSPALKLGKRLVACVAIHRSAEPGSLVVRTDFEQRAALLGEDPETYYITEHYANHPVVLVRLTRLRQDQLLDLITAARQCVLTEIARSRSKSRGQRDQCQN
jgi:hypothetical protein